MRGYGAEHQRIRRALQRLVAAGCAVCTRCSKTIALGEDWDLDHTDDRRGYRGAAHSSCNRRAGALKQAAARRKVSRSW
jgi:hypothetical protein